MWGLPPRPGWGASVAEEEARARPPGERPSLFSLGGDRVETVPGFLTLLSTPPSELVWSRRCLEEAGPRAAGGGQKAEGVAADPAVGARPSAEGPLQPLLQGDSHRPRLHAGWCCVLPRPLFLCQEEEMFMADGSVSGPCKHLVEGWARAFGGQINGQPDKGM